jgi:hypothetical protein
MDELAFGEVEVAIRDDDLLLVDLATRAGLAGISGDRRPRRCHLDGRGRSTIDHRYRGWLSALRSRQRTRSSPSLRIAKRVADRLSQTSLYRPDLDLFVETVAGDVASYGLFWLDSVTGVGFVEPMRTEHGHEGLGLGRHVLACGLERLAALGATRLEVNYEIGNQ